MKYDGEVEACLPRTLPIRRPSNPIELHERAATLLNNTSPILGDLNIQPFHVNSVNSVGKSCQDAVTAFIEGIQVKCLVDSGSGLTIIPANIAKKLKK